MIPLAYTCQVCGTTYEAHINGSTVIYMDGNKRIPLKSEEDDCDSCLEKIKQSMEEKRAELRSKRQQI